jgi:hypothetical protein
VKYCGSLVVGSAYTPRTEANKKTPTTVGIDERRCRAASALPAPPPVAGLYAFLGLLSCCSD